MHSVSKKKQVGVDATAARSCFLMLKIVLRTSGADVVFSGATRKVQALLRSHGVITDDDPVFNRWVEVPLTRKRASFKFFTRLYSGVFKDPFLRTPFSCFDYADAPPPRSLLVRSF